MAARAAFVRLEVEAIHDRMELRNTFWLDRREVEWTTQFALIPKPPPLIPMEVWGIASSGDRVRVNKIDREVDPDKTF